MKICENCKYTLQGNEDLPCTNCDGWDLWEPLIGKPKTYTNKKVIKEKRW